MPKIEKKKVRIKIFDTHLNQNDQAKELDTSDRLMKGVLFGTIF